MATLVLTTAGAIFGGPIGAAIGSQIDQKLFAPKGRQGPRLGDLTLQTSSYGAAIPKLFGTMRVAGTVIWATDLREDTHRSGGGKSGGKTTTYSYSASFAVALSGRPIADIGRIWADGNLLRGAAGDWKSETGFRLHLGDEDQDHDPLIAAAEGIDATPAHRGIAYAVFETMQLADYGNRIPSLTFEVIADIEPVPIAAIASALSGGALIGTSGPSIGGYAASGDSVRGAIEALNAAFPLSIGDDGAVLAINRADLATVDPALLGAHAGDAAQPRLALTRQAGDVLPDEIALSYYEPARDYQTGLQRARRDGIGRRAERIELPAALPAEDAKALVEAALRRAWARRGGAAANLPWRMIEARAGTRVMLGMDGPWRVIGWNLEKMALALTLARDEGAAPAGDPAAAGRATGSADAPAGSTVIALLDVPSLTDTPPDTARLLIAAAGTGAGWRRAELSMSLDGGTSWRAIGRTAPPATIGTALGTLAPGSAMLFDTLASVNIELLTDAMSLSGADDAALIGGANAALLGEEIIQFGSVAQIAPRRFRLARLLRGRRGTEWAIAAHGAGERFVLLDAATLAPVDLPIAALGGAALVRAIGPGDAGVTVDVDIDVIGRSLRPPAPIALAAAPLSDGTIRFSWTRRSRAGWAWIDGADVPLGEDGERYRLTIAPNIGVPRLIDTSAASYDYSPVDQALDGTTAATVVTITVSQIGTRAPSLPAASATLSL